MRGKFVLIAAAVSLAAASHPALAKKKPEMTPLQMQQMQTRDVETNKDIAFSSVMSVLQDSGYRIGSADKDTGLITGVASTNSKMTWVPFVGFGRSKKTPVVSAFIEQISPTATKIRLNFVMTKASSNQFGGDAGEEPILDNLVYQDAFEKIDQAIFIKQASLAPTGPSQAPSAPVAAQPAADTPAVVTPAAVAAVPTAVTPK